MCTIRAGTARLSDVQSLADYLIQWLQQLTADPNTGRGYESIVRVHLIPHLGDIPLEKLRTRHIRALLTAIEARNAAITAPKTSRTPPFARVSPESAPPARHPSTSPRCPA